MSANLSLGIETVDMTVHTNQDLEVIMSMFSTIPFIQVLPQVNSAYLECRINNYLPMKCFIVNPSKALRENYIPKSPVLIELDQMVSKCYFIVTSET